MKKRILMILVLAVIVMSVMSCSQKAETGSSSEIAPPVWLRGFWGMVTDQELTEMFGDEYINFVMGFTANDILEDGGFSNYYMLKSGDILEFEQTITNDTYSIYIKYFNDFWWKETFKKPGPDGILISEYEDMDEYTATYTYRALDDWNN